MRLRWIRLGLAWVAAWACACACAPAPRPNRAESVEAFAWSTPLEREHPLVGRIWDVRAQRFVAEAELVQALARARFVLLGEKHDNADHHRLQARLLEQLVARGRRPALVLEMLDLAAQPAVDRARVEHPGDSDALAASVDWEHSGWPAFRLYRPVFAAANAAALPIVAAGLDRDAAMRIAREGDTAIDPALAQRFGLTAALPAQDETALRAEMRDAHCGLLPEAMLGSMVTVQRVRDAQLAERLHSAGAHDGGVLIAGAGHVRRDRGVPAQLARGYAEASVALGFLEAQRDLREPGQYAATFDGGALPLDYVWFTPRANDDNPCAELRRTHAAP